MANLLDFFFEQLVTESDMDTLQANLEQAIHQVVLDQQYTGVIAGYDVVEHSPSPDLTVDIAGPGKAYDQEGRRVFLPASVTLDVSQDSNGSPTSVGTVGNEKWVSVFVQFERVPSDLRFDGNGIPVNFRQDEGSSFVVVQGAEALAGTAVRPALLPDALLIADILLTEGQTEILDADIESSDVTTKPNSRFQFIFNLTASSPQQIRVGPLPTAMQEVLSSLNAHINGTSGSHPSTALDYDPSVLPIPAGWTDVAAASTVQEAIDGVVTDLAQTDGASHVGNTVTQTFAGPSGTVLGANVRDTMNNIVALLGDDSSFDGAGRVGYEDSGSDIVADSVHNALDYLGINWGKLTRTQTWTGANTYTGTTRFENGVDHRTDITGGSYAGPPITVATHLTKYSSYFDDSNVKYLTTVIQDTTTNTTGASPFLALTQGYVYLVEGTILATEQSGSGIYHAALNMKIDYPGGAGIATQQGIDGEYSEELHDWSGFSAEFDESGNALRVNWTKVSGDDVHIFVHARVTQLKYDTIII